jgi:hypothetical protein
MAYIIPDVSKNRAEDYLGPKIVSHDGCGFVVGYAEGCGHHLIRNAIKSPGNRITKHRNHHQKSILPIQLLKISIPNFLLLGFLLLINFPSLFYDYSLFYL